MQLTTSKRISLKFTLYTIGIVFFFGFLINVLFFQQRYGTENGRLRMLPPIHPGIQTRFQIMETAEVPYEAETLQELNHGKVFSNIAKIDDQYIMFSRVNDTIRVSNISRLVDAQRRMIIIFFVLLVIFSIGTYLISLLFVKSSLKNIKELVDYVEDLDIHTLHKPVPLSGPDDDEIRIIGATLQQTLTTIKEQTDSLKDFVTHASHELKTPLMSLSAVIDAGEKTGDHSKTFSSAKNILQNINKLFETLLSITKREYHAIEKKEIDLIPLIQSIQTEISGIYTNKHINYTADMPKALKLRSNEEMFRIIFFNLLQNAYKYTNTDGTIHVQLKDNVLSLINSGPGIDAKDGKSIREKFWRQRTNGDSQEGFGLGLYLVKLLVNKHGWSIAMQSKPGKTTFSISLKT
ncbi:MAG: HAMP domain-containing sensor histidine kinase [candidate division SR1 bacterium]|nr:HAMP domain-containing sensor histidine kinase [candidate division SR1 bacterium]